MPIRSKRARSAGVKMPSGCSTYQIAPSPGPPAWKNSDPSFCPGCSAGRRLKRIVIFAPLGFDQSTGTRSEPHWRAGCYGQGFHSNPDEEAVLDADAVAPAASRQTSAAVESRYFFMVTPPV